MSEIGFIGIGTMGWPMAGRLVAAGHQVTVHDASSEMMAKFAAETKVATAATPAKAAAAADIVITMLPNSKIVEDVLTRSDGILAGLRPGAVIVDMTSGSPTATQKLAAIVEAAGGALIDAPVSGGLARARTGDLAIMTGGDTDAVARVMPILQLMGSSVTSTGAVGSAHAMKALNNLASAAGFLVGIECLLVGKKFGLEPETMVDILNAGSGMNNSTQKKFKQFVLSRSFNAGFGLDLMVKDLTIALDLARETGTAAPFSALCREMWASSAALLGPGRDHTEITLFSEKLAGAEI